MSRPVYSFGLSPDDPSARVLAAHAGFEIVEVGSQVLFFDRRTRGPIIAAAVSGGVTGIALINLVMITISLLVGGGFPATWSAMASVAIVVTLAIAVLVFSLQLLARRRARPRSGLSMLARLDRSTGMLFDGRGRAVAPVAQVRATRGMLLSSSAPSLVLRPPQGGQIEVFRGTPIGGGIDPVLEVLVQFGFAR